MDLGSILAGAINGGGEATMKSAYKRIDQTNKIGLLKQEDELVRGRMDKEHGLKEASKIAQNDRDVVNAATQQGYTVENAATQQGYTVENATTQQGYTVENAETENENMISAATIAYNRSVADRKDAQAFITKTAKDGANTIGLQSIIDGTREDRTTFMTEINNAEDEIAREKLSVAHLSSLNGTIAALGLSLKHSDDPQHIQKIQDQIQSMGREIQKIEELNAEIKAEKDKNPTATKVVVDAGKSTWKKFGEWGKGIDNFFLYDNSPEKKLLSQPATNQKRRGNVNK